MKKAKRNPTSISNPIHQKDLSALIADVLLRTQGKMAFWLNRESGKLSPVTFRILFLAALICYGMLCLMLLLQGLT